FCLAAQAADIQKVFSHCPEWKMWQFSTESGTTNSTHFLLVYGKAYFCAPVSHIYQVWGIVSFI
ncbi:hypothetical protein, partial [Alistipes dispar]|uniref:hypothetical protein n=1 Tax=Alistipes dispar TaxID=2585119 RepID=UPI003AB551E3